MKKTIYNIISLLLVLNFGVFCGAQSKTDDFNKPTKVKNISTGNIEALVVLIEFADRDAYFTRNEVDNFFNEVGYSEFGDNGSIHDYWDAVSQGRVNVHTTVTEYYKAPKTFDYYDVEDGGHTHELIDSALNWLDKSGFDFSQLTIDENNRIKGLSFQFVGNSGAKGLWGHSSAHDRSFDGVQTHSYQISELGTTEMHLGGICHEQGHMFFGWPDTYDIDGSNGGSNGCGKFDLMAGGNSDRTGAPSRNPMPPNPYFRYLSGWNDLIPMNEFPNDTLIDIIANSWNTYVYRNPDRAGEMYIIEARKKPFRNVDMPGEGVLVWHIDSVISNNANQQRTESQHYKVSVVQADNAYHLENGSNSGDSNDYFKAGSAGTLTYIQTKWWNGAYSGLALRNIGEVADTMTVSFGTSNSDDIAIKSDKTIGGTISPFGLRYYPKNSNRTFTATPLDGFAIDDCIVDGESKGALSSYTFSAIDKSHSIKFLFAHKDVALKDIKSNSVDYSYYEGAWASLPDFDNLTPVSTGTLRTVTISIPGGRSDNFGVRYTAYIDAPETGEYSFYLTADDGASFSIDGVEIVSNQCEPERTGTIRLQAGYHPFTLDFFEAQITQSLSLNWSGPNFLKSRVSGYVNGSIDMGNTAVNDLSDIGNTRMWVTSKNKLNFDCRNESRIYVEVFNISGILIDTRALSVLNGRANMSLDWINKGVYFVRVKNNLNEFLLKQKVILY